jgi:hypothetical protein
MSHYISETQMQIVQYGTKNIDFSGYSNVHYHPYSGGTLIFFKLIQTANLKLIW